MPDRGDPTRRELSDSPNAINNAASGPFVRAECRCSGSIPNLRFFGDCEWQMDFLKIEDGLGKQLFIGEKQVPAGRLGSAGGSDCSIYNGDHVCWIGRWAGERHPLGLGPQDDTGNGVNFGSWHPGICQFVFGDGRVQPLSNETDPVVLGYLAHRKDGTVIDDLD